MTEEIRKHIPISELKDWLHKLEEGSIPKVKFSKNASEMAIEAALISSNACKLVIKKIQKWTF